MSISSVSGAYASSVSSASGAPSDADAPAHRPPRETFRELNIGLVEGVDAEDAPRHRHAHLPNEEEGTQFLRLLELDAEDGVAGRLQRVEPGRRLVHFAPLLRLARRLAREDKTHEEAILPVFVHGPGGLGDDRHDAAAVLARALGDELFRPVRERLPVRAREEGDLVAPREREFSQRRAE